jgi:hypothetical protein
VKIDNFFAELKRRNVYKVAVAYAVLAWLLIQAASIFFPPSKHACIARQRFSSMFKTCTSVLPIFSTAWVSAFRHMHSPAMVFTTALLPSIEENFTV